MAFRVLIAEDKKRFLEKIYRILERESDVDEIVEAVDFKEAHRAYDEFRGGFDGIIVDGCLNPENRADGHMFIKNLRDLGFRGVIVAASSSDDLNDFMIEQGADAKVRANGFVGLKETAPRILLQLLRERL